MPDLARPDSIIVMTLRLSIVLFSVLNSSCISLKSTTTELLLDTRLEKYNAFHEISLVNTDITKELVVNGNIKAVNSKLTKVSINGTANIENSVINDEISINGKITLNKTVLKKNIIGHGELVVINSQISRIDMEAKKIILDNTNVGSIRIRKFKNATIVTRNGSIVSGNITFDIGDGRVIIDKQSCVKGCITSGIVKNETIRVLVGKETIKK